MGEDRFKEGSGSAAVLLGDFDAHQAEAEEFFWMSAASICWASVHATDFERGRSARRQIAGPCRGNIRSSSLNCVRANGPALAANSSIHLRKKVRGI